MTEIHTWVKKLTPVLEASSLHGHTITVASEDVNHHFRFARRVDLAAYAQKATWEVHEAPPKTATKRGFISTT